MRPALHARARALKRISAGVAVTITTQLDAARIIQRTSTTGGGQNKGQASVAMALSFTGAQPIYCRRRSYSDGATIVQSPWLANASASTGTITLSGIDVPAVNSDGVTPTATADGWAYLDVATSPSGPWTNATSQIAAGRVHMFAGQSLAVRMVSRQDDTATGHTIAGNGVTISPFCSVLAGYSGTPTYLPTIATMPWAPPADGGNYDSTFSAEFLRRSVALFGCPVGFVGYSQGSQTIASFLTGQSNGTNLQAILARAGGAWEAGTWYQGHSDPSAPTKAYVDTLGILFTQLSALNSYGAWNKYIGSVPCINASAWGTPYQRNNVRKAHAAYAAVSGNKATHVQIEGIVTTDGTHPSQIGNIPFAQNFARAVATEAGASRTNDGPAVLSVTRVGAAVTVNLSDVGQGNLVLTGTPTDKIYVFPQGRVSAQGNTANLFPVSAVSVVDKKTLSVTLANDPGDGHVLDFYIYWPQNNPSPTAQIRDDRTDSDGIAFGRTIVPNQVPATIAAPNPGSTVNAPPGGFIKNASPYALANGSTAVTFGSQEETGFNQTASGGWAATVGNIETWSNATVVFTFTVPAAAPAFNRCIVTNMGIGFVLLTTAMKFSTDFGNGTTVLTAGHRYRVAYYRGPNGTHLYFKDITAAGAVVHEISSATAFVQATTTNIGAMRQFPGQTNYQITDAGATLDEIAIFYGQLYTGSTPTLPSAPFTGTETDLYALWHLDGDLTEVVAS